MAAALDLAPPEFVGVDHNGRVALAGGLSGRPGLVLIAGTGTLCFGLSGASRRASADGFGPLVSDEDSGYWFGLEAVRAAVRAADGRGPGPALEPRVREHLGLEDWSGLLRRLHVTALSRAGTAALAPLVFAASAAGDGAATHLLNRGVHELVLCVAAVTRRLELRTFELTPVGGLFSTGEALFAPLRTALAGTLPGCTLVLPE